MDWFLGTIAAVLGPLLVKSAWNRNEHIWRWIIVASVAVGAGIGALNVAAIYGAELPWRQYLWGFYAFVLAAMAVTFYRGE